MGYKSILLAATASVLSSNTNATTVSSTQGQLAVDGWTGETTTTYSNIGVSSINVTSSYGNTVNTDARTEIVVSGIVAGTCIPSSLNCISSQVSVSAESLYTYTFRAASTNSADTSLIDIDMSYFLQSGLSMSTSFNNVSANTYDGGTWASLESGIYVNDTYSNSFDTIAATALFSDNLIVESIIDDFSNPSTVGNKTLHINANTDYFITLASWVDVSALVWTDWETASYSLTSYADPTLALTSPYINSYSVETSMANQVFGDTATVSAVPIPAAVWLFGSGLIGLIGFARRKKA